MLKLKVKIVSLLHELDAARIKEPKGPLDNGFNNGLIYAMKTIIRIFKVRDEK